MKCNAHIHMWGGGWCDMRVVGRLYIEMILKNGVGNLKRRKREKRKQIESEFSQFNTAKTLVFFFK